MNLQYGCVEPLLDTGLSHPAWSYGQVLAGRVVSGDEGGVQRKMGQGREQVGLVDPGPNVGPLSPTWRLFYSETADTESINPPCGILPS